MAAHESGSGPGNRELFNRPESASPHSSKRISTDDDMPKIDQQINILKEGAKKEGSFDQRQSADSRPTDPHIYQYRPDDFVNDEMSPYGSMDFVALARLEDSNRRRSHRDRWAGRKHRKDSNPVPGGDGQNGGYSVYLPHHGGSTTEERPDFLIKSGEAGPVGGVQGPLCPPGMAVGAQPVVISRRKAKAKLRKRRKKALKAAAKAQAAQAVSTMVNVDDVTDSTAERLQVKSEQQGKKRKDSPSVADEPDCKIVMTESRPGHETSSDSVNNMEAPGRATLLVTVSNSGAEGQRSVLSIEEELAQLNTKLQEKKVPLADSDRGSRSQESSEDTAPASNAAAEGQSCMRLSTPQKGCQTPTPDGTQRKRGYFEKPGMTITAQRIAFVCPVCKFRSFYRRNMAAHLKSKFHRDHFRFLSEHLSEPIVDFLQTHISHKHKKVEDFINQIPNHHAALCQLFETRDLTQDISLEHFMRKAEAAHCLACDLYIPMQHSLIQQHLSSPDHHYNCKVMMVQSKNSGLSTAQHILRNRFILQKLKLYLKDSMLTDGPEVNPEEVWPTGSTGERAIPGAEEEMMKQEMEPFCEQELQAAEAVSDGETQEMEPLSEGVAPASEAQKDGKEQQAELMREGLVPAAEEMMSNGAQQEPEHHDQAESLFDLLNDDDDDVEGVELGEEELGEDDYI